MNRGREMTVDEDCRVQHKWFGAAALVWAAWGFVSIVDAATIVVTTTQDGPVGLVAGCSLREAVHAINTQANGNGCANASTQAYGANDRIRFAADTNNVALTLLSSPLASSALSIQRPVDIRGRGRETTIISGGGGNHILLDNATRLTLRSLSLVNAGMALQNQASASATLLLVRASGHRGRAIRNLGLMTLSLVRVSENPGGGIANGNATPVQSFGDLAETFLAGRCDRDCCNNACGLPGGSGGSGGSSFPLGQAPAGLVVTRSRIVGNGPIACAGIVNGGGMVDGSSGITGVGNPLVNMKIEGALTLRQSRVSGNVAGAADGGGICNLSMASIIKSEISENSAARGAGVLVRPATETVELTLNRADTLIADSTISTNVASIAGGGIVAERLGGTISQGGNISLQFTTITANSAGGGAAQDAGGVVTDVGIIIHATATVIAGNTASPAAAANADCASTTLTGSHNFMPLSSSVTCSMSGSNNQSSDNPGLGPLTTVTSETRAHVPIDTSVLVDSVPASLSGVCSGRDQRNLVRPRDGNGDGSASCDRGAVER